MMPGAFDSLLTGGLSARISWERSHRCPCVGSDGAADRACQVCQGRGRYFDAPSAPFRAGLTNLSAKAMEYQLNKFGPGMAGDSTLSLPSVAPCYGKLLPGDRILALDALETREWVIHPSVPLRLPSQAFLHSARVRQGGAVVDVALPAVGPDGLIRVAVATAVAFEAPRRYEVLPDQGQIRAFSAGLPRKHTLKLIDLSTR